MIRKTLANLDCDQSFLSDHGKRSNSDRLKIDIQKLDCGKNGKTITWKKLM